jgi:hypothetical protein
MVATAIQDAMACYDAIAASAPPVPPMLARPLVWGLVASAKVLGLQP